jgi:hypothetical protein
MTWIAILFAQVVTENAGTVSPETPLWQTRLEYFKAENVTDLRAVETFIWAPDATMDFALSLPFVHRDVEFGAGIEDTVEGIGDASLRWKYSLYKTDDVMKSTRFSLLLGTKFPTGPWHEEADGVRVPRKLQLGTGSFDFTGGLLFTHIDDRHRFAAEVIGRHNLEADDFQLQPSLRLGLAYWYRVSPARIETAGEETEVRGVIEITSIFYGESELDGSGLGDDGNITWISPGIQIYPAYWILFEVNVQIPVVQTVEDQLGDRKFSFLVSVKFLF